jgi:hypothetical protein
MGVALAEGFPSDVIERRVPMSSSAASIEE